MAQLPTTRIEIAGPEHSKKTTIAVLVAKYLRSLGVEVVSQRADPQFAEKEAAEVAVLEAKVAGAQVVITEMHTR